VKKGILALAAASLALVGCASTKLTAYTDPAFQNAPYRNFVAHATNGDLETQRLFSSKACEALRSRKATCTPALDIFPPTRQYTDGEVTKTLKARGVDGYLLIAIGGGSSSSQYLGSQSLATVNAYGTSISSTNVAAYSHARQQSYDLVLIDIATQERAWVGGARVSGQGALNVTDEAFASSLSIELVTALRKAGHITK
jgi:hypothetical protein